MNPYPFGDNLAVGLVGAWPAFGHKPSLSEMFLVSPLQGLAPGKEAVLQRAACAEQVHSVMWALVTDRAAQGQEVASVFQD